jgi:hypothetical protein
MDRKIVYPSQIPFDTDVLLTNQFTMIAIGYLAEAVFGSTTVFNGLACLPTSPTPDLNVHVQRGMIASMAVIEQTSYGSLPADTSDPLMKIGINTAVTSFSFVPPSSAGYSQNFLIEAQFLESDTGPVVLPYYNSANPAVPYSGPGNSGTAQNTQRIERVSLQVKAGTAWAPGGSAVVPGADAGWTPLWVVNVSNGQTQITSSNITIAPGAPFLLTQLSQLRQKLTGNLTLYVAANGSDTANNGLSTSAPFLTPQAAWNALINTYDLNGYSATISLGAGTFPALNAAGQPTGFGANSTVTIQGAGGTSTFITTSAANQHAVNVAGSAAIILKNVALSATGTGASAISVNNGSSVSGLNGVVFGACGYGHISALGGVVFATGNYSISGAAISHFAAQNNGAITLNGLTITGSGALAFTIFANAQTGSMNLSTVTFSGCGSFTGQRYFASMGGSINTNGGGVNFLPGNVAGSVGSGTATGFYG